MAVGNNRCSRRTLMILELIQKIISAVTLGLCGNEKLKWVNKPLEDSRDIKFTWLMKDESLNIVPDLKGAL